jgi:hypothetical protein
VIVTGDNKELWPQTVDRKTIKWTKKVALWLINCAIFNSFLVYKNLIPDSKLKYKAFLMNVAKDWATDKMEAAETVRHRLGATGTINSSSMYISCGPPGRFWVICGNMSSQKL